MFLCFPFHDFVEVKEKDGSKRLDILGKKKNLERKTQPDIVLMCC